MSLNVLFSSTQEDWEQYHEALETAFSRAGLDIILGRDLDARSVDYIVFAPKGPATDFTPFSRLKAVLSLWAGVESIVTNPTLRVPLSRMVDSGLREGMAEWVTGHVLRYHLGMDDHIIGGSSEWIQTVPPLARNRKVGVLGLGELGSACATALANLNFDIAGWSRRPKSVDGVTCYHGNNGLDAILARSEILVLLLPLTSGTENLMDKSRLGLLPKGARILNPGRGALIDDGALLDALNCGQIGHATLDVFRIEPLPPENPYWTHPNVTVTPHIASDTRAETASLVIAENIRRTETGDEMLYVVDRISGY